MQENSKGEGRGGSVASHQAVRDVVDRHTSLAPWIGVCDGEADRRETWKEAETIKPTKG